MSFIVPLIATQSRQLKRIFVFAAGCTAALALSSTLFSSIVHAETGKTLETKLSALGYAQGEAVDRIEHYRVDGWNYIDDQHIVIYAGPSNRFLITLLTHCRDLSSTEHIGFTTTTNSLTKFDKLVVRDMSGIMQNCPITQINTLTKTGQKQ
ncbi:MAG: DUF6491 family protein [Spongiibacteraceae bacterium]